jgi:hypothetical protein
MHVGLRDHGWVLQDGKPLLFGTREEAEEHSRELNTRSSDARYMVASWPGNPGGIVDLEVAVLDVRPQPVLNAVEVEIANPTGDGVRILLDLGLTLDFALRLVGSAMRLRRLIP